MVIKPWLILFLFCCGCDDSKNAPPHTVIPDVGIITLKEESVNITSKLPGELYLMKLLRYARRLGIILSRQFKEGQHG